MKPLIVIVGPTASGKTAVAIEIAKKYGGEIICADSRTVYKELTIGTAKPTHAQQTEVPHWGIDLVCPDEKFAVSDFKQYADSKIAEIRARGRIPLLVGGTGLYVDSVVFGFKFGEKVNQKRRTELESLNLEQLHTYSHKHGIALPENSQNKRYVIRNIERNGEKGTSSQRPKEDIVIVGIATDKRVLDERIEARSEQIFSQGVVNEAKKVGKKYGWHLESMTGNIYPLLKLHLDNEIMLSEVQHLFTIQDRRLAKRQMTWFRRNPHIVWLGAGEVVEYIDGELARRLES